MSISGKVALKRICRVHSKTEDHARDTTVQEYFSRPRSQFKHATLCSCPGNDAQSAGSIIATTLVVTQASPAVATTEEFARGLQSKLDAAEGLRQQAS